MVPAVRSAIYAVANDGPICDLFAGSGTVSYALSQDRDVIAVDIQEYSRVLCSALMVGIQKCPFTELSLSEIVNCSFVSEMLAAVSPLVAYEQLCFENAQSGNAELLCDLVENASLALFEHNGSKRASDELRLALRTSHERLYSNIQKGASLLTRHFGGAYFSFQQAAVLDGLRHYVNTNFDGTDKDFLLAVILSCASDIVNTVGKHFAQPIRPRNKEGKPKPYLLERVMKDRSRDALQVFDAFFRRYLNLASSSSQNVAIRDDFRHFLRSYDGTVGAFYADPPYTRDHYSRFYHVLETICTEFEPVISTSFPRGGGGRTISRGLYRTDRHQSPFSIKSKAKNAFVDLFEGVATFKNAPLVLSYSPFDARGKARPRLMNIDQITGLARRYFKSVKVSSIPFAHSKLNVQAVNAPVNGEAEVLITCIS
jgi:adenine-specific DNA methylase